jgi:PTS system cellobiose-specific IIC component
MEKMSPAIMKLANSKILMAIRDGVMMVMPLTLVGSIFLLIANFPLKAFTNAMASAFGPNWTEPLNQVPNATFSIMALVAVFGIAYSYTKSEGLDGVNAGILGLVSFLIIMPPTFQFTPDKSKTAVTVSGAITRGWTDGHGIIAAILLGLLVGYIYTWFISRDIRIKMPDGVPEGVVSAFTALIPAAVVMVVSVIIYILFKVTTGATFFDWIYKVLQYPMQGATDSLGGALLIPFMISFLWFFGIHGASVVSGVMTGLLQANSLANQDIVNKGGTLVAGQNAHIVCQQFLDQFITFGGSGMTLGLVVAMILTAKSQRLKTLGELSIVPGLFNINEPILFGMTIVLNPMMALPFILVPMLSGLITYTAIAIGFVHPFTAVMVPWTTPPIISGFVVSGWQAALLQALLILMSGAIYFPFMKALDKQYVKDEREAAAAEAEA